MSDLRRSMDDVRIRPRSLPLPDFASARRPPFARPVRDALIDKEECFDANRRGAGEHFPSSSTSSPPCEYPRANSRRRLR